MEAPPAAALGALGTSPEPEFEGSICLDGPCDHLWMIETSFAHGNTPGTFDDDEGPHAIYRSCLRAKEELELKGLKVYACNQHSDPECRKNPKRFDFSEKLPLVQITKKEE